MQFSKFSVGAKATFKAALFGSLIFGSQSFIFGQCYLNELSVVSNSSSTPGIDSIKGEIRFVDKSKGNDANPGTMESPWATLQFAVNKALPGYTILVKPGEYGSLNEEINFRAGTTGNPDKWITIKGYPRRAAVVLSGFNTMGNSYTAKGAGWIRIEGLTLKNGIFVHNTQGAPIEVIDNKFDFASSSSFSSTSGGCAIYGSNSTYATQKGIVIKGNHIYGASYGVITGQNGKSRDWLVENNIIERLIYRSGDIDYVRIFGEGHIFRGNIFFGTRHSEKGAAHVDGFQSFNEGARNILIENNIISGFDEGIMVSTTGSVGNNNWTIRNNIFSGTYADSVAGGSYGISIHASTGTAKTWNIVNNVYANNKYHGIYLGDNTSYMTVKNNFFYNSNMYLSFNSTRGYMYVGYNMTNRTAKSPITTDKVGVDPNLVFVNPVSVYSNPVSNPNYFELKKNSPAINAGESLSGLVNSDMRNVKRPQGSYWDIGPYEYVLP